MDENELQNILQKLRDGVQLTDDELRKLAGSSKAAAAAMTGLQKTIAGLGKTAFDLTKKMADGAKGASAYNDAIESGSNAVADFAGKFGFAGKVLGGFARAIGFAATEVNKLSDRLYKTYGDLGKSGLTAADGMSGLADAARRLGFGLDEAGIAAFADRMRKSSSDLALLSGSAIEGRKRFTEIGEALADRGPVQRAFGNLGYSVDQLADMSARYIQQEVTLGRTAGKTNQELVAGTKEYIKLLDTQAKLTGQSVESLQEQMDANLRNERFQARILELQQQGRIQEAENLRLNMAALSKVAPEVAEGLMDLASGYPQTKKAQQALMSGMGDIPRQMERQLGAGFQELGTAAKRTTDVYGAQLGKIGQFGEVFGSLYEQVKLGTLSQQDFEKQLGEAIKEQQKQMDGQDKATDTQTQLRISQMKARDSIQGLMLDGVVPLTDAMSALTKTVEKILSYIPGARSVEQERNLRLQKESDKAVQMGQIKPAEIKETQKEFYDKMYNTLLEQAKKQGVANPEAVARLGAAQSSLETGYGKSTAGGNNYFGIKATPGQTGGPAVATQEYDRDTGKYKTINARFRQYGSMEESAADYIRFLKENPRYAEVLKSRTAEEAILAQGRTGYATDPQYAQKLASIHGGAIQKMALGGITKGISIAGEAGPEAVVPLPDGRSIPVDIKSQFSGAMAQTEISQQLNKLLESPLPGQEMLKASISEFQQAIKEFTQSQSKNVGAEGMVSLMSQLVELQRNQNRTSEKILQVSQN